jgi:hypothetical protein
MSNRDEVAITYDPQRGERSPAGTTLGEVELILGQSGAYFDYIRENIAQAVKKMLYEEIIPNFRKENNKEHYLRLAGEDLEQLKGAIVSQKVKNAFFRMVKRNKKRIPLAKDFAIVKAIIEEKVKQAQEKILKIPKGFYDNLKYELDIIITGEEKDVRQQNALLMSVLQAITVDPTVLQDSNKKKILGRVMENSGIRMEDVFGGPSLQGIQGLLGGMPSRPAGGGVSRPQMPQRMMGGQGEQTI